MRYKYNPFCPARPKQQQRHLMPFTDVLQTQYFYQILILRRTMVLELFRQTITTDLGSIWRQSVWDMWWTKVALGQGYHATMCAVGIIVPTKHTRLFITDAAPVITRHRRQTD